MAPGFSAVIYLSWRCNRGTLGRRASIAGGRALSFWEYVKVAALALLISAAMTAAMGALLWEFAK